MTGVVRSLLLLLVSVWAACVESKYTIVFPNGAFAGQALTAVVTLADDAEVYNPPQWSVTLSLKSSADNKTLVTQSADVNKGETKQVALQIPSDAKPGSYWMDYEVPGKNSSQVETINIKSKTLSTFVQTDKAKYKPGDTVLMRVFAVTPNLKPFIADVDISIFDAQMNKIKQWDKQKNDSGVITTSLALSEEPILGDWTIRVVINGIQTDKKFTIEKYVLPKFEVTVDAPSYALDYEDLQFTVRAKYTFGKPVYGTASIEISQGGGNVLTYPAEQFNGELKMTVAPSDLKGYFGTNLIWSPVQIRANVTETVTGNRESGETKVDIKTNDVVLEFTSASSSYYKPGLEYVAYIKATRVDGTPLASLPVNTRHEVKLKLNFWSGVSVDRDLGKAIVPDTGIVSFNFYCPDNVTSITLEATYIPSPVVTVSKSISAFETQMKQNIQIMPDVTQTDLKVGQDARYVLRATANVRSFVVLVKCRGKLVFSEEHTMPPSTGANQTQPFTVRVTTDMTPSATLLVYSLVLNSSGSVELIADSYPFQLDQIFDNNVTIDFSKTEAELGSMVDLNLGASPGSFVAVLAVDQSVQLLAVGNDITKDDVMTELQTYDSGDDGNSPGPICRGCVERRKRSIIWWPGWWQTSGTTTDVLQNAGYRFYTNAQVEARRYRRILFMNGGARNEVMFKASSVGTSNAGLAPVTQTRTDFPETWLWTDSTAGADGRTKITAKVPDTITSWKASAFALSKDSGLGIAPNQATLRAFKDFFISMNLPYSVKQDEEFPLVCVIFNYLPTDVQVLVTLNKSDEFKVKTGANLAQAVADHVQATQTITVQSGVPKSLSFWVVASNIGSIKIRVQAQSNVAADAVERFLIVDPKGTRKTGNVAMMVEAKPNAPAKLSIAVQLPATGLVPGSTRVEFQAIGDILGTSIQNLDQLLQMPYGCGEQNMINFAPAIFITKYLNTTNQLTAQIKDKAFNIMEKGYQRELIYKHTDNSFSAFGNDDGNGSMWLTAFVLKCFYQAKDIISVDKNVIDKAQTWLIERQLKNGTFEEPGRVIHTDMQGGSATGLGLTAYGIIALVEGRTDAEIATMKVTLQPAIALLESSAPQMTVNDTYLLSIMTYALTLVGSPQGQTQLNRLKTLALTDALLKAQLIDGFSTPKSAPANPDPTIMRCYYEEPKSRDVEQGSYLLLTLARNGDRENGRHPARWLISQRNANGGFSSTQDTVLGLQALSEYGILVSGGPKSLTVEVKAADVTKTININAGNSALLQTALLPPTTTSVDVVVTGEGSALVQVSYWYNVDEITTKVPVHLTLTTASKGAKAFQITICTSWTGDAPSGMALLKVNMPSGFVALPDSVKAENLKRIDVDAQGANIYLDEFTVAEKCVQLDGEQAVVVSNLQPAAVQASPYYSQRDATTAFYATSTLSVQTDCQMCPYCLGCNNTNEGSRSTSLHACVLMATLFIALRTVRF